MRRAFHKVVLQRLAVPVAGVALFAVVLAVVRSVTLGVTVFASGALTSAVVRAVGQWRRPATSLYQALVEGSVHDRVRTVRDAVGGLDDYLPDPGYAVRTGYVHLIQTDLQRVISLVATDARPLVVFVDDLDRCAPAVVLQVLEAVNLFLAGELRHCVFVLGIEPDVLTAHIEASYDKLLSVLRQRDPG